MIFRLLLLFSLCQNLYAQRTFMKHFGTASGEYGTAIVNSHEGGYLISQIVSLAGKIHMGFVKTDANGHLITSRVYTARDFTVIKCLRPWRNGYIGIATTWDSASINYKTILFRLDQDAEIVWMREFETSNADLAAGLAVSDDYFYLTIAADYNVGSVYPKIVWMKTDTSGLPLITRMYSAPYMITPMSIALNDNGKTAIVCESNSFGAGSVLLTNLVVSQFDSAGNIEWSVSLGTPHDDMANEIVADSPAWVIAGQSYFVNTAYDASLFRVDDQGNLLNGSFYDAGTIHGEVFRAMINTQAGSVLAGDAGTFDERNMFLLSADLSGAINWSMTYPVSVLFTNYPFDLIAISGDSGYVFTGDLRPPTSFRNAALFRTDSAGMIGCLSQPLNMTRRTEPVEWLPVTLTEIVMTLTESPLPWAEEMIPILENTVCEFPSAGFAYLPDTNCPLLCLDFIDESVNAIQWEWNFPGGQPDHSNQQHPQQICYDTVGIFSLSLTVSDGQNFHTLTRDLTILPFCDLVPEPVFIPNVISPNGDNLNDLFLIKNITGSFHLQIFNRWGNRVFETMSKSFTWPTPQESVSDGVYFYILEIFDKLKNENHHGTLLVITP
jgi:gliding motility-associated-like protein